MNSTETESILKKAIQFHGHQCPGLAIGIQVSKAVLQELGKPARDEEMVAIVENNSCGLDAIQLLTGCTFGKGNLIFNDFGKYVYTFMNRENQKALRISVNKDAIKMDKEHLELFAKIKEKTASPEEQEKFKQLHINKSKEILKIPPEDLMVIKKIDFSPPPMARLHDSVDCAVCGESVMETKIRLLNSEPHCIPCFEKEIRS
jgi:formylmethanofuran dehydrogenase subunit E